MDLLKTVAMVTVLLAGFTYSQDCSVFTTQEACCLAAEKDNCTYCQASDGTTQACLNVTQAAVEGACVEKLCQTGTETPPSGNTTTPDDVTSPSNHSDPITLPTSLPSNHTSTPKDATFLTQDNDVTMNVQTRTLPHNDVTTSDDVRDSANDDQTQALPQNDVTDTEVTDDVTECTGFDAASFIGGVVLMGGVASISFFASKFWQARNEHNYHTL